MIDCGHLDDIENGVISHPLTIYDSVAIYSCTTGYTLIGASQRTCLESGDWSGSEPTCSGNIIMLGTVAKIMFMFHF